MTDPSIRVSADVSGVERELQKVQAAAAKVNQTLTSGQVGIDTKAAKADLAALEASASDLAKLLEQVRSSGDGLAGVDFGAITEALDDAAKAATDLDQVLEAVGQSSGMSATVRNAKQTADHIQRAARAQEILTREGVKLSRQQAEAAKRQFDHWRQSGARGTSRIRGVEFDDWLAGGWRSYSMDETEAARHRARVLESVGVAQGGAGGRTGRPGAQLPLGAALMRRAGPLATTLGGIAGSMTGGGDGGLWSSVGTAAGSGLGGAAGFALGGPAGAMLGSMLGSAMFGGLGRSADSGIERSRPEGADLTDLRRMLGATSVDFDMLRGSVRHFAEGLGLTYGEAAKLARSFAHTANVVEGQAVGREVGSAAGFARGFGMAPEAAAQFFATMRHYGVSGGDRDSRKLALQIAEGVTRGGSTAKMDEVLSSIQSFVQSATRQSLTQANAEAYASFMSSLTGLSMFGIKGDPQAAASAMGSADAALRQGGGFGEASKNFSLGLYQRMLPGFTGFDQDFVNEQGAFGTLNRAFNRDSAAYRLAQARGDAAKMAQYDQWAAQGGDRTILSLQMEALEKQFGRDTDEFRKSLQGHLGVTAGQASALYQAYQNDTSLGGLNDTLTRADVDVSRLNTKQIAAMAEVAGQDDAGIRRQATRLMGLRGADALGTKEAGELQEALAGNDPEALRKTVLTLTALHDTTKDQGEAMRKQQADMANAMQKLATELIPLTLAIKEGIVALVKELAPESEFVKQYEAEQAKQREDARRAASLDANMGDLKRQIDGFKEASPEEQGRNAVALHQLKQQRDAAAARGDVGSVSAYDDNITKLEAGIRAASAQGRQDLIDRYNALAAERNGMRNVAGEPVAPLEGGSSSTSEPSATSGKQNGKQAPRNARNNNPGNIEYGDFAKRHGAVASDGRFAIFPTKEAGSAAMDALLQNYKRQGRKTLRQIINRWAPSTENDTNGYVKNVAKRLGVGPDDPLDMDDPKVAAAVAREMARMEGDVNAYVPSKRARPDAAAQEDGRRVPADAAKTSALDPALDRKAPSGLAPGVQTATAQRQDIRIDNRVTLYDQNGQERGNSVVQTRIGSPVPQGVAA